MKKLLTLLVIAGLLCGLISGCGNSSSTKDSGKEATTEAKTEDSEASTGVSLNGDTGKMIQLGKSLPTGALGTISKVNEMEKYSEEDVERVNKAIRAYTPSVSDGLLINNASHFYYYDQLTSPEKDFYEAMLLLAEDPVSADYYISVTMNSPITEEQFAKSYFTAYQALCFDHPELFWLYNYSKTSITAGSLDAKTIYFTILDSYTTFESDMKAFNQAADKLLSKVDRSASQVEQAKQIHDLLCDTVTYDFYVLEHMDEASNTDLAHTAYGALVQNSRGDKNTAVCDGYSLAYQYLLTQCGIDAVVIAGKAGEDSFSLGGHAWNVAKLDGSWYEIDSTWNDNMKEMCESITPDVNGYDILKEALSDPEYSDHIYHYLFGLATPEIEEYKPDEKDIYITKDKTHQVCLTGESFHKRANQLNDMEGYADVISAAPEAAKSLY